MRTARPPHPGPFIRTEVIEPLGLSVTGASTVLGVTRPALSALLNGRAALSPDMALRIEKAFGSRMDTLLRMQVAYEIAAARGREADIKVKRYVAKREAMQRSLRSTSRRCGAFSATFTVHC
jgi:addiction module HigA family antidote